MAARTGLWCVLLLTLGFHGWAKATAFPRPWKLFMDDESYFDYSQDGLYSYEASEGGKCPLNEHFDRCQASCQQNCFNYYENPIACPSECKPGCICDIGYVRGPDGRCIKPKKCPKNFENELNKEREAEQDASKETECPINEHFDRCKAACQQNCYTYRTNRILCPSVECSPGCICDEGYLRGPPNGRCIKPNKCPENDENDLHDEEKSSAEDGIYGEKEDQDVFPLSIFCKNDEKYSLCPSVCPDNCTNYMETKRPCRLICLPLPACVCKSGYIKGPDGECIKSDQCPKEKRPEDCTDLEQYTTCGTSCEDNCDNYQKQDRECDEGCKVGCFCLPGYVRGPKGDCVYPFDCPAKSMTENDFKIIEEKFFDSLDQAEKERDDQSETYTEQYDPSTLPAEEIQENEISPDIFHQSIFCKKNEVYSLCPIICPDNCTNYQDKTRACRKICLPLAGCVCKSGFIKGPDGTCIKPEKCRKEQKPEDCSDLEYYDTCGSSCPDDCNNYNNDERVCDKQCNIGCFCRPGMVRGPNGQCIWPFECEIKPSSSEATESSFCPMHEDFHPCHASSELDCSTKDSRTPPKPPAWCLAGCRCLPGYVRGPEGLCIEPSQCPHDDNTKYPVQRICPENEKWSSVAQCQRNCTDPGRRLCPSFSSPGCVCKEGFIRNKEGMCISEEGCPEHQGVGISENVQDHGCRSNLSCGRYCMDSGKTGGYCADYSHGCPIEEECWKYCLTLFYKGGYCVDRNTFCVCCSSIAYCHKPYFF